MAPSLRYQHVPIIIYAIWQNFNGLTRLNYLENPMQTYGYSILTLLYVSLQEGGTGEKKQEVTVSLTANQQQEGDET